MILLESDSEGGEETRRMENRRGEWLREEWSEEIKTKRAEVDFNRDVFNERFFICCSELLQIFLSAWGVMCLIILKPGRQESSIKTQCLPSWSCILIVPVYVCPVMFACFFNCCFALCYCILHCYIKTESASFTGWHLMNVLYNQQSKREVMQFTMIENNKKQPILRLGAGTKEYLVF